ncbi:MAG: hypothetical protein ACYST5_18350, partial [Planctomycetota bacterium]
RANIVSGSGQYIPEAHRPLHAFTTTKSRLSVKKPSLFLKELLSIATIPSNCRFIKIIKKFIKNIDKHSIICYY